MDRVDSGTSKLLSHRFQFPNPQTGSESPSNASIAAYLCPCLLLKACGCSFLFDEAVALGTAAQASLNQGRKRKKAFLRAALCPKRPVEGHKQAA